MKIRLTADQKIPSLKRNGVFDVQAVTECRGETIYFIHHTGNYLGISESQCEVVMEDGGREVRLVTADQG